MFNMEIHSAKRGIMEALLSIVNNEISVSFLLYVTTIKNNIMLHLFCTKNNTACLEYLVTIQ